MRRLVPLIAVAVLAACGSSSAPPKDAIARVGHENVEVKQFDALVHAARTYYRQQKKPFPATGTAAYKLLRDQMVKRLVQGAVFVQEAKNRHANVGEIDVDNAIETLKQETYHGSDDQLQQALHDAGITTDEFRREQLVQLSETALQSQVLAKVKVSDAAARRYYLAHRSDYRTAESRPVRHILLKTKAEADALYARLQAGASFQDLMEQYSTDAASKGGTGKMTDTRGLFVPPFEKVAFALKTGEVSKPVHTEFGWHIIQALGPVTPAAPQPFSQVKGGIKAILLPPLQQQALKAYTQSLYRSYCAGKIVYAKGWSSTFCSGR